ncbi:DNA-directed RNA polymerase III subunit RPC3-like [Salvelinus namaycush]|uniref:DNA-directed RNA polymerase III subunit RPC3 n=1 Tax=Salvelinus namaycush TaxID=8040 RepID=A0A8U0QVZ1_SALNM|nr:DNA-directed RNA polymerase III subunit RPC3-like [Salvelinus namaycush]
MTAQEVRLCGLLLQEHFGEVVERIGTHLLRGGAQNLRTIANETNTPLDLVKKSLCVLVQHGACEFGSGRRGPGSPVEYRASCERVLRVLRYPRYIYTAKTLYGDTGELIVEEVLQRGHMTMSNTVKTVADRLTHNMEEGRSMEYSEVVSAFSKLVETHFLQRCPPVAEMGTAATSITPATPGTPAASASTAPPTAESNPDCYKLPHVTLIGRGKRRCSSDDSEEQRGGKKAKMDSEMEFVGKSGDSGGGMYVVNLQRALANLARATLESVVQERFGSRSARIFRLLLRKRHLEQKQVEDFAMIPAKEAKDMLYTLLSENLVQLQEIPKTPDHAPSRTFYLYTVNQLPTARLLLQHCYKTVANLIERRLFETKENKRLLEKSQRIEAILASQQASGAEPEQLTEVEEMITAPERQQLEALRHHINKLDSTENQVDETVFLLESYIFSTKTK